MTADLTIAQEILQQLGGNRFIAMTGAKNLIGILDCLTFRIGQNRHSINRVCIALNRNDLYDMTFCRTRGSRSSVVAEICDVYAEDLQKIFTEHTGLETHL